MSDTPDHGRPRQVSLAAGTTIVASVVVVVMAFGRVAGLHSLETREAIAKFVADQPAHELGLSLDEVVTTLRILTMVSAACAAAAAVLAFYALRRNTAARTALTFVALPLFLTGRATGAVASSIAAAAAVSLWFEPSRAWFAGRSAPASRPRAGGSAPPTPPTPPSPPGPAGQPDARPADPGRHGSPPPYPGSYGASAGVPTTTITRPPASGGPGEWPARQPRPRAVTVACVLTWVATGLTALLMVATAVVLLLDPDLVLERAHEQNPQLRAEGVTDGVLVAITLVLLGAMVLWCVAAAVLGVLVLRGVEWARVLLVISAGTSGALSLVGAAAGAVLLVLTLGAAAATLALLVRPEVRAFFRRR